MISDIVRSLVDAGASPETILAAVIEAESDPSSDAARMAVVVYNAAAERCGWAQCLRLNPTRSAHIKHRLKEAGGIDGWRAAMDRAEQSEFLTGGSRNGWLPNIDFFLQQSSFQKLIEGGYDRARRMDAFALALGSRSGRRSDERDCRAPGTPLGLVEPRKTLFG